MDEECVERVQAAVRQRVLGLFERHGLLSRETVGVMHGWGHTGGFSVHALPPDTVWWHQQRVLDAAAATSSGGQAWLQNVAQPSDPTRSRQKVYAQRDASGLSRKAFFMQEFGNPALAAVKLEVGQLPPPAAN